MKFTASRLSEGNKIFPAEIYLDSIGVTVRIPGLFSGESKQFDFNHIVSVDINTPMIGFSTITIFAGGTKMSAHGFTKIEVKQIQQGIKDGQLASKKISEKRVTTKIHSSDIKQFSVADEIIKLKTLLDEGTISRQEFESEKAKL